MNDEKLYLKATNEVESENRNPALWAKVLALAEGDHNKAKYQYIKLRVEQLAKNKTDKEPQFTVKVLDDFDIKYMPIAEFSNIKSIPEEKIIEMIRHGFYVGQIKNEQWYISREEAGKNEVPAQLYHHSESTKDSNSKYVPVEELAEFKGISTEKAIAMIRDGFYQGRILDNEWYVSISEIGKGHVGDSFEDTTNGYGTKAIVLKVISIALIFWGILLALDTLFATWIQPEGIVFIRLIISGLMLIGGTKIWKSSRPRKSGDDA